MKSFPCLTIDGPSGSGKGTISLMIAQKLGWDYLDSGALYRILAYEVLSAGIDIESEAQVVSIASGLNISFEIDDQTNAVRVYSNHQDITDYIRTESCGNAASKVAAFGEVRAKLLTVQRGFLTAKGLVADGRDMGTTVFSEAFLKIFLTASTEERAKRRYNQLKEKGINVSLSDVSKELIARDDRDSNRTMSPLKPAHDAIIVDSSKMTINQVVTHVLNMVAPN